MDERPEELKGAALSPKSFITRLRVVLITVSVWVSLAVLLALRAGTVNRFNSWQIVQVVISTLAGPFAFVDVPHDIRVSLNLLFSWAIPSICLALCHPIWQTRWAAILSVLGVSFWFMLGFGLTYIGV